MLCDNCNKNEATVHYTEVINGVKKERHLCSECMQEFDGGLEGEIPFSKLIRGLISAHLGNMAKGQDAMMQICCDKCNMTYSEFAKVGKFGCGECYSVFGPLIIDNIKRIQGDTVHSGKKYKALDGKYELSENQKELPVSDKIEQLRLALNEALLVEDYHKAARIRDEIKALKEGDDKDA